MQEIELAGVQYRTGRLDAFEQFHLFRKLAPLFSGMGETFTQLPAGTVTDGAMPAGFWHALEPVANAIAEMSQEDSEFILRTCLKKVTRRTEQGTWARLTDPSGALMFDDLDLSTMLNLAFTTIQDNLGDFLGGPSPNGSDPGAFPSASSLSR